MYIQYEFFCGHYEKVLTIEPPKDKAYIELSDIICTTCGKIAMRDIILD